MKAILLVNTGSPKSCTRTDVKSFVGAMLSDPLVMTVPDWFRPILVKGLILPLRQFSSTKHYSLIWDHERNVSPLIFHAKQLAAKLEEKTGLPVEIAMRYEEPNIQSALKKLAERSPKIHEVIVFPLFPQYAESSYKTVVDAIASCFFRRHYPFRIKVTEPYFNNMGYIDALAESIRPYVVEEYNKIIFSFHSLPLTHVEKGWEKGKEFDYVFQTKETIRLVTNKLGLDPLKTRLTYHSAMGSKWIGPDLDETVEGLGKEGKKKIIVVCPGFAADNLETLYDVDLKTKELFLKSGGENFTYVPCLNSEDYWVNGIIKIIS